MGDMSETIIAKSDQLNASDLIDKTMVIKITRVDKKPKGSPQPITIHYENDNGKPYKPSLTMRRIIVEGWQDERSVYIGRSLKLFRNPDTKFSGEITGGIEISHMSDITDFTVSLQVSKGVRKKFSIKKLDVEAKIDSQKLKSLGEIEAKKGLDSLRKWFESLSKPEQIEASSFKEELKKIASEVVA